MAKKDAGFRTVYKSCLIDCMYPHKNEWDPPALSDEDMLYACADGLPDNIGPGRDYLIITQVEPFIDSIYVHNTGSDSLERMYKKRFVFHDGYIWDFEDEKFFSKNILENSRLDFTKVMEEIFDYYSKEYPDWKLNRYYTKRMRMLDHIYHCMRRNSAKEMLYKAGLDELAAHIDDLYELNLMSSKPSDIYSGISIKTLRSLNCREGSLLLASGEKREFLKEIQKKFPNTFKESLNDAQCRYLSYLIDGDLTVGEVGRLFNARRKHLLQIWAPAQYQIFLWKEKQNAEVAKHVKRLAKLDPIYKDYIGSLNLEDPAQTHEKLRILCDYLIIHREELDKRIRRSNRKRNQDWQERKYGYVVRFPQTINDYCREAIYMCNCLMTYVEAYMENDTTILFMRKSDDINAPFITIEIYKNELMQAYHRFNDDCNQEEASWILKYCDRHGIRRGNFKFDNDIDELM